MNARYKPERQDRGAGTALHPQTLARRLGWFSVGLGFAQLFAPRAMSRAAGVEVSSALMRAYGLRELACGMGILLARDPTPFLWARAGGDVLDMATLAATSNNANAEERSRAVVAAAQVAGVAALDVYAAQAFSAFRIQRAPARQYDYSDRTGFPRAASEMRGAALVDFEIPRDMRAPDALRAYTRRAGDGESTAV